MHPVLRLSKIQRLPPTIKRVALAACSPNRSLENLEQLREYMESASEEQHSCLAPVFYFNLDPQDTPNTNGFDPYTVPPATKGAIARAWSALTSLARVVIVATLPMGIGVDLWPRISPWTRFFHLFYDHLPWVLPLDAERSILFNLFVLAGVFMFHPPSYGHIESTPGFWFMLGRAWSHIAEDATLLNPPIRRDLLFNLSGFLMNPVVGDADHLAQVVEGVGGSFHDLARTATLYLAAFVPSPPSVMDILCVHSILNFLKFIRNIDPSLDEPVGEGPPLGAFGTALLSHQIVRVLTDTVWSGASLLRQNQEEGLEEDSFLNRLVAETLAMLALVVTKSPGDGKLSLALESRLLTTLVLGAQLSKNAEMVDIIQYWIGTVLPRYLVRYRVVRALESALAGVADLASTDAFRQCPAYDNWTTFLSIAQENIRLLDSLSSTEILPLRACDNIQGNLTLCTNGPSDLSTEDRAYLRALVHHDYEKAKSTLAYDELLFRHGNPGEPLLVLYDYTQVPVTIGVRPLKVGAGPSLFPHGEGADIVSRVTRSGGRMRLDILFLPNGLGEQPCIIPLRRNRLSRLDEGVGLLAGELPSDQSTWDVDSVKARLNAMLDDPGLVEIH
ncbi:hypothetical protein C8R46DRAFT_1351265 [Mycena filopes]|nr:hypothetical protein C8R46DRAFT_1351265 [Mycena filopes]